MRVTSNLYPEVLKSQLQDLQEKQLIIQTQIATGKRIQKSSEDPLSFAQSQASASAQSANNAYLSTTQQAQGVVESTYLAMTDITRLLSRAGEIANRSTGIRSSQELAAFGVEMESILNQIAGVANRQTEGKYLFGGTGNVAPIVQTAAGPPATYEYNNAPVLAGNTPDGAQPASYTANTSKMEIIKGNIFDVGIVAGRTQTDNPAGGAVERAAFSGFLVDTSTAPPLDILGLVMTMRDQLNAGSAIQTNEVQQVERALNWNAEYVGKTASRLAALDINTTTLQSLIQSAKKQIDSQTATSMTDAITDLQKTQLHYQAALQSGAKILSMSLLDYLQ